MYALPGSENLEMCAGGPTISPTVILGVAASDSHAVANHIIALHLRQLGYHVVNLGPCTPISEFADCFAAHPDALAVIIGSVNGHAVEDVSPLRAARAAGLLDCPVIVGGNLSVGSAKTGDEPQRLLEFGVDHVVSDIDELTRVLDRLRRQTRAAGRSVTPRRERLSAVG
ncbi:hypothetical protein [Nocardia sp. CDC160]|uniref:hypothetical protein n=1 Tax=Nocardia sp. CDC160 TaxID=3112166 RepID=UPI002DB88D6A|nr:hypothetical protein [Nocardia sp. CDC160]MEC3917431.1 hypothetical protein [Nocardia sp. CDC160]